MATCLLALRAGGATLGHTHLQPANRALGPVALSLTVTPDMSIPLHVLLVEDTEADAVLALAALRAGGYEPVWERVQTAADMAAALEKKEWQIVLSDYQMPGFDALGAIQVLRESGRQIPLIIVSGTIGEDTAVEAMRLGAADYLLKDRLTRLAPAVAQVMEQHRLQRESSQSMAALRASEERYRTTLENIMEGCQLIGFDWRYLYLNKTAAVHNRRPNAELLGKTMPEVWPGIENSPVFDLLRRCMAERRPLHEETEFIFRDGSRGWFDVRAQPVPEGIFVLSIDITERWRAEDSLRRSEERFRGLIENASDMIAVINDAGVILFQSPSTPRVLGYRADEMVGRPASEFIHPEDRARVGEAIGRAMAGEEKPTPVDFRILHRDGTWRTLQSFGKRMAGTGGERQIVVNSRDVTESRAMEEQLRQSQKMEAIGQLSGGVAHDFNNLLTVIKGYIGLLRAKEQVTPEIAGAIQQIDDAADRAANLTRQLLTFSRQQVMETTELNLTGVVMNLTKMLRRLLSENIEMNVSPAAQPLPIRADEGMVEQVLLNLVVNARDAMPRGGRLEISTARVEFDEQAVQPARPGAFAVVAVTDTGTGIAPEVLPRIFEPFFTTKQVGRGTGLGLATVYGVMQQHHGWVTVESLVGRGTTFRAYFPRLPVALAPAGTGAIAAAMPGGHEGILLVEDEVAVREIAQAALTGLGYRVFPATNGLAALQVWEAHRHEISLMLTDLVMPDGMTGRDVAVRLRESDPRLPIIYMSGYSYDVAGNDFVLKEGVNYLPKPFGLANLAEIVRAMLDRGASQSPFPRS